MNQEMPVVRLSILGIVIISLFAALFSRLWYLQVMDSTTYKVAAKQNQVKVVFEPAPRGKILDRNGAVLVDNRYRFVVTLTRDQPEEGSRRREQAGGGVEHVAGRREAARRRPALQRRTSRRRSRTTSPRRCAST